MALTLLAGPANAGKVALLLERYLTALDREPQQAGWRFELARLLCEQRRFAEARGELLTILATQPGNGQARALLATAEHGLASGE